jgi:hypothetical protein
VSAGVEDEPVAPRLTPSKSLAHDLAMEYPESAAYRFKRRVLGKPLVSEQLSGERLSRPIALGVLAPDCISSSAYGTEEMLTQMTPIIGLAAFSLLVPITFVILGVLFVVTLSYLDVIGFYTSAGGSYVVARDNFGPKIAQIAAVALLIDYTVTVAVQCSAGTAALTSAVPSLATGYTPLLITIGVVLVLIYGNLRGIREAGTTRRSPDPSTTFPSRRTASSTTACSAPPATAPSTASRSSGSFVPTRTAAPR